MLLQFQIRLCATQCMCGSREKQPNVVTEGCEALAAGWQKPVTGAARGFHRCFVSARGSEAPLCCG